MPSPLDNRILSLLTISHPIIQAPMAGADSPELAVAVSSAGGLGSLACAMLTAEEITVAVREIRKRISRPFNLNFFCHQRPEENRLQAQKWKQSLESYYREFAIPLDIEASFPSRTPFDDSLCTLVETLTPPVVSFHFGLPEEGLVKRVKATGAIILSSATTVEEARWLEAHGADAVIAQGYEAGGHRGMFLHSDTATQTGTLALVPQIVDAVSVPVIAAGGIGDARGIAAAIMLGASAVQLGTAYLFCPEARISPLYRKTLRQAREDKTVLTNLFTGRPARGIINRFIEEKGPLSTLAPSFPLAGKALAPLRAKAEQQHCADFSPLWSGQAAYLCKEMPAQDLTEKLAKEMQEKLGHV